jgi:hypothetical protein
MFPGPNATVYYNEAGEVTGWDNYYPDDAPEEPDWDRISDDEDAWEHGYDDGYHEVESQVDPNKPMNSGDRAYLAGYQQGGEDV